MKLFLAICVLMANVASAVQPDPISSVMPAGFEEISIGMDWSSLVALRSKAEILNMMPDSGDNLKPDSGTPRSGLVEKLSGEPYDQVLYSFEDGVLVALMFGKGKSKIIPLECWNEIRRIGHGRGEPTSVQLIGKHHEQGVVSWLDRDALISVMVPADEADTAPSVFGLQVLDRKYADRIKVIGSDAYNESDGSKTAWDKTRLDSFKTRLKTEILMEFPYGASPERISKIRGNSGKLVKGMGKKEVAGLLGDPDLESPTYSTHEGGKATGSSCLYLISQDTKSGSQKDKNQVGIRIHFDLDGKLISAHGMQTPFFKDIIAAPSLDETKTDTEKTNPKTKQQ